MIFRSFKYLDFEEVLIPEFLLALLQIIGLA